MILMTLGLGAFSPTTTIAQHDGHPSTNSPSRPATQGGHMMSHDHMMMANEPHHVLAMAYHQNLAAFAKALQEQTAHAGSVDVEFARAAVNEMRRSFDQMEQHHQRHMQTMSAEMHTTMSARMEQMETHRAELNTQLTALEREVRLSVPDAKRVSALAASIQKHLEVMSKMKHDGMAGGMNKKM